MILGIFSPTPTSLGEKMPKLSGILCDDNDDDDRDVVGCGDGGISLPGGCTRVSLILSPRDHSHCDDGDQHSLVSLMLKGGYCNFFRCDSIFLQLVLSVSESLIISDLPSI